MSYTDVFGGQAVPPSGNAYSAVALTADTTFSWPQLATGTDLMADIMDVTPTGAYAMTLPVASLVSNGRDCIIRNLGASTITVNDSASNTIGTVLSGTTKYIYLTDNSTAAGVWGIIAFGTGTSASDPSALAGNGLIVDGLTLAGNQPVGAATDNLTLLSTHRAKCLNFTTAGKTLTLLTAAAATAGFVVTVKNSTTGSVTITRAGSDLIDTYTTFDLSPLESVTLFSTGSAWVILAKGMSTQFQFTKLVKDISSATSFTLTSAEASNKLMQFIGTPTANTVINVPAVVAVYYIQNVFTNNGYSLTIKTAAGTGVALAYSDKVILYCDGTNVVTAQSTDAATAAAASVSAAADAVAAAASAAAALVSETAAAASELAASNYAGAINSTSTTSVAIATGSKTFTTQAGKQYSTGAFVTIASTSVPTQYMHGQVTSYATTTLIVDVQDIGLSFGTYADWAISVSGTRGTAGAAGGGDMYGPASAVSGELSVFDGPTGKLLRSATTTGLLKATSGVPAAATAADVTGQLLTGYSSGAGTVGATDTILQAINKLNGNTPSTAQLHAIALYF